MPPENWKVPVIIVIGILVGLLAYLFYISKAWSYVSDSPETCTNCHIMAPQYSTWSHSAHREFTNCNECHVPHNNVFNKYFFKAKDGLRHATIFTLRAEPQVIFIKDAGRDVVHQNCISCHENVLTDNKMMAINKTYNSIRKERYCWDCHRESPHGRVNGLSSTPFARVPLPNSAVPVWLKNLMQNEKSKK